ncbi:hypothetical protein [Polaromonas sp.]|uniref:hypothetical protein n=1 Tax=Polaromonas sp. TaxID=1869339 RepID=UPI001830628C|nr:hypothetical protein [Polaromonas sp.]NML87073.1 hypothetical protein [Polaromonas sp.]
MVDHDALKRVCNQLTRLQPGIGILSFGALAQLAPDFIHAGQVGAGAGRQFALGGIDLDLLLMLLGLQLAGALEP